MLRRSGPLEDHLAGRRGDADSRHVYFTRDRSVECLDAATGRKLWSVHLTGPAGRPVRAGGLLYARTVALDAATGRLRATGLPGTADHSPVIAGGRLYVK